MAILKALLGLPAGQRFELTGPSAVLGRHPDCDIVLDYVAVSRRHARIVREADAYYVEDLRSRNGTFVNGQLVEDRRRLEEGDKLAICDLLFSFHISDPDLPPPPAAQVAAPALGAASALLVDDPPVPSGSSTVMSRVDVSGGSAGLRLEVNAEAKLKALIEISQSLGGTLGLSEVLPKLLDSLFKIFVQADRGFVILREPRSGRLVPQAIKHRRGDGAQTIRLSRTIIEQVMAAKQAILSADAAADERFELAESIVEFQIRSMMCAPLLSGNGDALGVIQIDTLDQRSRFSRQDLDVLAAVACLAGQAVENAQLHEAALRQRIIERDLALAHEVQRSLLPAQPPRVEPYEFFAYYEPAHEVGGDYYDYVDLPDGRVAVVLADVSGKGISASLLMARLSAETRFCLAAEPTPGAALGRLNRTFCSRGWEDRFVTMVLSVIDPARHEVTLVNAGHLPPLLRRAGGEILAVSEDETRLPVGVDPEIEYPQCVVSLAPGDSLTLYTDGITEAMNERGELFGLQRLRTQLAVQVEAVEQLGRRILDHVRSFVGTHRQSDDMCLACFRRRETPGA